LYAPWTFLGEFLDQDLISYLVVVLVVGATVFKKASGSVVSNGIEMKFSRFVLQVNAHQGHREFPLNFRECAIPKIPAQIPGNY